VRFRCLMSSEDYQISSYFTLDYVTACDLGIQRKWAVATRDHLCCAFPSVPIQVLLFPPRSLIQGSNDCRLQPVAGNLKCEDSDKLHYPSLRKSISFIISARAGM
jgi:hypothetical protein